MGNDHETKEPGARDIDVRGIRGVEEAERGASETATPSSAHRRDTPNGPFVGAFAELLHPEVKPPVVVPPRTPPVTTPPLSQGDWLSLAGLITAVVAGVALYLSWDGIKARYELHFQPERYWAREVNSRRFGAEMSDLLHQECVVDVQAVRAKEPLRVKKNRLMGISETTATKLAAAETAAQEGTCEALANLVTSDRQQLNAAEQELARVRAARSR